MSSGKCKLKQDTITHLLEWPKSATLTTANAGEDMEQQNLSDIDGGNANRYSHSGRQFDFVTKLSVFLPYDPAIALFPNYTPS